MKTSLIWRRQTVTRVWSKIPDTQENLSEKSSICMPEIMMLGCKIFCLHTYEKMIPMAMTTWKLTEICSGLTFVAFIPLYVEFGDEPYKTVQTYKFNAVKCQKLCQDSGDCVGFVYEENSNKCSLYQTMDTPKLVNNRGYILTRRNILSGPKFRPEASNECSSYDFWNKYFQTDGSVVH